MKNRWVHRLVASLGVATCFVMVGELSAQEQLKKDVPSSALGSAGNVGAEYQVMFDFLGKISQALQGSTDSTAASAKLVELPRVVDEKFETKANLEPQSNIQAREHGLKRLAGSEDFKGQPMLAWFLSKDFNIEDPFSAMMDSKQFAGTNLSHRERVVGADDSMAEAIAIPQFMFAAKLTQALDTMVKDKDSELTATRGPASQDANDLDPLTSLLKSSATKDKQ